MGLSNVEKVLLDTADAVMDTKRKIEFGVQQIIFKVSELIELSGGEMDDNLAAKFETITRTILSNQTEALTELTSKVDDNLNYMLGQLSLVVSEFNQVKTGLGEAMEGIGDELLEEYKKKDAK